MNRPAGLVVLGLLVAGTAAYAVLTVLPSSYLPTTDKTIELTTEETILVAAFKEYRGASSEAFCLTSAMYIYISDRSNEIDDKPVGNGASPRIVSALAAQGYNIVSATECVYRQDGAFVGAFVVEESCSNARADRLPKDNLSEAYAPEHACWAEIIELGPVEISQSGVATVAVGHWNSPLGCAFGIMQFSSDGQYLGYSIEEIC